MDKPRFMQTFAEHERVEVLRAHAAIGDLGEVVLAPRVAGPCVNGGAAGLQSQQFHARAKCRGGDAGLCPQLNDGACGRNRSTSR